MPSRRSTGSTKPAWEKETRARPMLGGTKRADAPLDLGKRNALLSLVLAAAILVRRLAHLVRLEEDHLRDAFVRVDLRGQRRRVRELERDVALPFGLERRHVDDDAATRVRRLAEADREHVPWDTEVLHGPGEREGVGGDDADVALEVDERLLVERLRVDDRRVDVGEDLEVVGAADVVAVARRSVRHNLVTVDGADLPRLERLDHPVLERHAADPFVGFDQGLLPGYVCAQAAARAALEGWLRAQVNRL